MAVGNYGVRELHPHRTWSCANEADGIIRSAGLKRVTYCYALVIVAASRAHLAAPPRLVAARACRKLAKKTNNNTTCALLFFGLVRNADMVFTSIEEDVIWNNPECDIFAHTYNVSTNSFNRSNEIDVSINPSQIYRLSNNVVMDTESEFHAIRNVSYYRQFFPPENEGWKYPVSMDNMIKQWHSIERVWELMEASDEKYQRVGLFRLDTLFTHPINVRHGEAVIPYFMNWMTKDGTYIMMNDRLFYGTYENAKTWASTRFDQVDTYLETASYLHSERFVAWLMRNVTVEQKALCIMRARATGVVLETDCMTHEEMLTKALMYDEKKQLLNQTL